MKITKDALILAQVLGGGGGITPTGNQDISTLDEYDVSTKATARVSADERAKIIPENIKQGETILGVEGSYSGELTDPDVRFYDYDGTLLYGYTKDQFLQLAAMPANPTHEGLTAQGWNWTLSDAQAEVADMGRLYIGQMYTTDDGSTRFHFKGIVANTTITLKWSQTIDEGVNIDWGDSSAAETISGTGDLNTTHTYATDGDYIISLKPVAGCILGLGDGSNPAISPGAKLQKVNIGEGVPVLRDYSLYSLNFVDAITIPSSVTEIGFRAMSAVGITHITIPSGVAELKTLAIGSIASLISVSLPKSITSIAMNGLTTCYTLTDITVPSSVQTIGERGFENCYSLSKITAPQNTISGYTYQQCVNLKYVTIIRATDIGYASFSASYNILVYDFSRVTVIPNLWNAAYLMVGAKTKILVPSALYDTWKAATNWSTYASKIVAV